jgi:phage terminase small subunit
MAELENKKHERFCQEYIVDLNATQAAIRAGYSKNTANEQGCRLLAKNNISARVNELQSKVIKKLELTQEWVLEHLKEIVSKSMQEEEVMKFDYQSKEMLGTGEYIFDSKGANRALELIGKHLGMFTDKLEVKDTTDYALKLKAARERAKNATKE